MLHTILLILCAAHRELHVHLHVHQEEDHHHSSDHEQCHEAAGTCIQHFIYVNNFLSLKFKEWNRSQSSNKLSSIIWQYTKQRETTQLNYWCILMIHLYKRLHLINAHCYTGSFMHILSYSYQIMNELDDLTIIASALER